MNMHDHSFIFETVWGPNQTFRGRKLRVNYLGITDNSIFGHGPRNIFTRSEISAAQIFKSHYKHGGTSIKQMMRLCQEENRQEAKKEGKQGLIILLTDKAHGLYSGPESEEKTVPPS